MFNFLKRKKVKRSAGDAAETASYQAPASDPNSPLGCNQLLFERLNHDIETNALPDMPAPSAREVTTCEERRREALARAQSQYDAEEVHEPWGAVYSLERVKANQEIPIDVELWVDAVCNAYLHDAKPMMGLVKWEENVRKKLYNMKGHTWYSFGEIYPTIQYD